MENTTDFPNSKKVIEAVPIEGDIPENILDSDYVTVVYETEDLNARRVNETVMISEKSFDDSDYVTVIYETEDINDDPNVQTVSKDRGSPARTGKIIENIPDKFDCNPDDPNSSRVGSVNETDTIPEKSFDDITDDPNVQNSDNRGSLARTGKILENTPENPTPKKVVVIPILRSKKQVSAKKERSKRILKVS